MQTFKDVVNIWKNLLYLMIWKLFSALKRQKKNKLERKAIEHLLQKSLCNVSTGTSFNNLKVEKEFTGVFNPM